MKLDCECGFVARGSGGEELVAVAQAHARDAHLVDLSAEVILALAGMSSNFLQGHWLPVGTKTTTRER